VNNTEKIHKNPMETRKLKNFNQRMVEICCKQPAKQTKEKNLKLKLRQQTAVITENKKYVKTTKKATNEISN
jgi:hypothetical protein